MVERRRPQVTANLEQLKWEIQSEHEAVLRSARTALEHAIKAGKLLIKAKDELDQHGQWSQWLADNCPFFSERTAQRYMQLAREAANPSLTTDMSIEQALGLIQEPQSPGIDLPDDDDDGDGDDGDDDVDDPVQPPQRDPLTLRTWIRSAIHQAEKAAALAAMEGDWSRHADLITPTLVYATQRAYLAWASRLEIAQELYRQQHPDRPLEAEADLEASVPLLEVAE